METRFFIALGVAFSLLAACASSGRKNDGGFYGPQAAPQGSPGVLPAASPSSADYGPSKAITKPIVLILGPGLAREFAASGFVRRLSEEQIPVGAVVGTETGALVAALYASAKTVNELDWKLMQFKEETFVSTNSAFSRLLQRGSSGKEMEQTLRKVFGKNRIENTRIPLRIGVFSETQNRFQWVDHGEIVPALLATMATQDTYDPIADEKGVQRSPLVEHPFPVQEAKDLNLGPVVVFDVLTEHPKTMTDKDENYFRKVQSAEKDWATQLAISDQVIRPAIEDVSYFDFSKRNHADFLGQQAANESLGVLRHLVGLPEGNPQ